MLTARQSGHALHVLQRQMPMALTMLQAASCAASVERNAQLHPSGHASLQHVPAVEQATWLSIERPMPLHMRWAAFMGCTAMLPCHASLPLTKKNSVISVYSVFATSVRKLTLTGLKL